MADPISILAKDRPLSERTIAERRNLILASAAALTLNAGSVGELLGFPKGVADPALAKGAFCIAVIYLLLMFVVWVAKDVSQWETASSLFGFDDLRRRFDALRDEMDKYRNSRPDGLGERSEELNGQALELLNGFTGTFNKTQRYLGIAQAADSLRLAVEVILPIGLAGVAIWKLHGFVPSFLNAVFG